MKKIQNPNPQLDSSACCGDCLSRYFEPISAFW